MTQSAAEILSRDLFALADEAGDHLKDAARKSGTEATEALQRSTQAITRAADRLRDQAETSAVTTREQVAATVRAYPVTAGVAAAAAIAVIATLATMRLSQS